MNKSVGKKIVIVGGGFGGSFVYKYLKRRLNKNDGHTLRLIDKRNHFVFTPLLHEVATGGLSFTSICEPFRSIVKSGEGTFLQVEVQKIDPIKKIVFTTRGELEYDYLVISTGSKTNFFGISGAQEHSFTLKSVNDAMILKHHFIDTFENASALDSDDQKNALRFVIVGGGATGVELACEMSEYFYDVLGMKFSSLVRENIEIVVLQRREELIPDFPEKIRKKILEKLSRKKIRVRFHSPVTRVEADFVEINGKEKIFTNTCIWTAGVVPNKIAFTQKTEFINDQLQTNKYLQLTEYPNIFVLGDASYFANNHDEDPLPLHAQVACKQAFNVACNIDALLWGKPLTQFSYKSPGLLLSAGKFSAYGQIKRIFLSGIIAWFVWRTVYFFKHVTFLKRVHIAFYWFLQLFFERDTTRI